jgi:hypothetical protein
LGHVATHNLFPCSPKKLHPSCKQQYVYDKSKDEGVFCWLFLSFKIRRNLSNGVSHSTYMHQSWVNSQLFVVGSQIVELIPDLSFCHNLCCRCPNGSCRPIFEIYTLIAFQRVNARCFDPCHQTLKFRESR